MFTFDWLNIKMILSETNSTSRLNLIDILKTNQPILYLGPLI